MVGWMSLRSVKGQCRIHDDSVAQVEYAVAALVRLVTAAHPRDPRIAALDRSAYLILHEVLSHPDPPAVQDLAGELKVDLSTMSRQVSAMEAKGLLERVPEPHNSRVHRVQATQYGRDQFKLMKSARLEVYKDILDDWPEGERARLAYYLQKLSESVREYQNCSNERSAPDNNRP
ncbi:MAG: MarR family transcriptional regulator [Sulfobacillus thermosulfidooxidans]|nr:MAG: MarR family transcriptional regulator [Sulfobacillus thermosulfidooxidans]